RAAGDAEAAAIQSEAQADRDRIMAFADSRASAIRAQGQRIATEYYKAFAENEDLAAFLRKLDMLKKTLGKNTTYVLSAEQLGLDNMLSGKTPSTQPSERK